MKPLLWILQSVFGCHHGQMSRVFTIKKRTYRVCCDCGEEFDYFLGVDVSSMVERCPQPPMRH